jgi:O-antigen ligase
VLLISGSRSGILCLFLILITFFTKDRNVYFKFLFIFLFIGIFFFLSNSEFFNIESTRLFDSNSSGIEIDKEKEYRIIALNWLVNYYNENIHLWFTGIGFNQLGDLLNSKVIFSVGEFKVQGDIHNSYFQFLFENGLITFGAFMFIYILPSILNFLNSQRLLYFYIPAMVIPYFENNLNAGQFLFFPFVFSFIYLSNKNKFSGAKKYGN